MDNFPGLIRAGNASNLFVRGCAEINNHGHIVSPRGERVKELNNVTLVLWCPTPKNSIVLTPERKISLKYLIAEWLWYVSGNTSAKTIGKFASMWNKIANETTGSVNSNYGFYFFQPMFYINRDADETTQFEYIIKTLNNDTDSRQALVNINHVAHKFDGNKDFPCTVGMQFFIRDNHLSATVIMRSTDIVWGFCNDIFQFTMFLNVVWNELKKTMPNLELGTLTLFTTSLHMYERHWDKYKDIENNHGIDRKCPCLERYFGDYSYDFFRGILDNNPSVRTYRKRLIGDFGPDIVNF